MACPDCGLPHHRSCWMQEGHCHLQHLHNTDEQWSREKTAALKSEETVTASSSVQQACPRCGTKNPEFAEICTHCGMMLSTNQNWNNDAATYTEYRPYRTDAQSHYSDISSEEELDGIKIKDLTAIVNTKTDYYIPRFYRMTRGNRASWNWAAFLITPYWLLYRKMYAYGIVFLLLQLLESGILYLMYNTIGVNATMDVATMTQYIESAVANNPSILYYLLSFSLISGILFLIKIVLGLFGNRLYQHHCSNVIRRVRANTPDLTAGELATIGGTSMAMVFIGYIASYFITQVLALLLL